MKFLEPEKLEIQNRISIARSVGTDLNRQIVRGQIQASDHPSKSEPSDTMSLEEASLNFEISEA
jgi:hypothetical protein